MSNPLTGILGAIGIGNSETQQVTGIKSGTPQSNVAAAAGAASDAASAAASLPSAFSSIQDSLSAFYDKVTDGKMWRSLGWIVLGIFFILLGLVLLLAPSIVGRTPVGRAVKLARG